MSNFRPKRLSVTYPLFKTDPPPMKWSALRYGSCEPKEDGPMSRKRHKPEEIVAKLRQVDVLVAQGTPVADAIRTIGVTEVTYYRWRQAPRRTVERRDLLLTAGGQSCDRKLATARQFGPAACLSGLPTTGSGGVRARLRLLAGGAIPPGAAGQEPRSATTNYDLTFTPDHPMGAGQRCRS